LKGEGSQKTCLLVRNIVPLAEQGITDITEEENGIPGLYQAGDFFSKEEVDMKKSSHGRDIERAIDFVEKRLSEPISLDEVARESGFSKFHFTRLFKSHTGMTFKTYHNLKRIEKAGRLLKQGDLSVSEVCYELGFNDLSYFDRVFRRFTGRCPSDYFSMTKSREPFNSML